MDPTIEPQLNRDEADLIEEALDAEIQEVYEMIDPDEITPLEPTPLAEDDDDSFDAGGILSDEDEDDPGDLEDLL